jgi:HEAT repeat protein
MRESLAWDIVTKDRELGWLHLTDLHVGGDRRLWPTVKADFLDDLPKVHRRSGPWDIVFFTGDLVYSGEEAQFQEFDEIRKEVFKRVRELNNDVEPAFLAIPGNHDVLWSKRRPAFLDRARIWHDDPGVRLAFWADEDDDLRRGIEQVLAAWDAWWALETERSRLALRRGKLPGDFAVSVKTQDLTVGVVGLNSTFLQLERGVGKSLALDVEQLNAVCGPEGGPGWAARHDVTVLLTHHPPDWLDPRARPHFRGQILRPGGNFDLHLCGHQHVGRITVAAQGGEDPSLEVLGRSLFGIEHFGNEEKREHGYSAGRIRLDDGSRAFARLWPRRYMPYGGEEGQEEGWHLIRDPYVRNVQDDEGTKEQLLPERTRPSQSGLSPTDTTGTATRGQADTRLSTATAQRQAAEQGYREWLLRFHGTTKTLVTEGGSKVPVARVYVPLRLLRSDVTCLDTLATAGPWDRQSDASRAAADRKSSEPGPESPKSRMDASAVVDLVREEATSAPSDRGIRLTLGELIRDTRRFVVVGKAGAGKTTLKAWVTAGLVYRHLATDGEPFPDSSALPEEDLLPIIYQCGDLPKLPEQIDDLLKSVVEQTNLSPPLKVLFVEELLERLNAGTALLLVDGLDELHASRDPGEGDPRADSAMRADFCAKLGEFSVSYHQAPFIVTTRAAAYAEIENKLDWHFAKVALAEWSPADKEAFASQLARVRWPSDTDRQAAMARKLTELIHNARYHELTRSPLMLATMAVVLKPDRDLPETPDEMYAEAVNELLHRRRSPLDDSEALPQLRYIAYTMLEQDRSGCTRADLNRIVRSMRAEIDAAPGLDDPPVDELREVVRQRSVQKFVSLLVNDTDIVTVKDTRPERGVTMNVYDFPHKTFKEFLAGQAIAYMEFPGATGVASTSAHIAELSERITASSAAEQAALRLGEPWVNALLTAMPRLGSDTGAAVRAILGADHADDVCATRRPRAVLAALCLAVAEPRYVADEVVDLVLNSFVAEIDPRSDGRGTRSLSSLDGAAVEMARSVWVRKLCQRLVSAQGEAEPELAEAIGGLVAVATTHDLPEEYESPEDYESLQAWVSRRKEEMIRSTNVSVVVTAVLGVMYAAFRGYPVHDPQIGDHLIDLLDRETVVARAAAWALWWFSPQGGGLSLDETRTGTMLKLCEQPDTDPVVRQRLMMALATAGERRVLAIARAKLEGESADDPSASRLRPAAVRVIGELGRQGHVDRNLGYELLCPLLEEPSLRSSTARALGALGNLHAIESLTPLAKDPDERVRASVAYALGDLLATQPIRRTGIEATSVAGGSGSRDGDFTIDDAVSALIERVEGDTSSRVREGAAWALGTARAIAALGALGERLAREGEEVGVRRAAAGALGLIGGWSAITALEGVLDDPDVRREAAQALADMGEADASDVLLARVASGDTDLLAQTMHAIDHLDTARCLQRLNRMPALTNPEAVRKATAQVTAVLARRDEPQHADDVSRILNQLVADPEDAVRRSALEAVTGLAGWLDEQALAALAMDPDPTLAQLALSQLRPLPDDRALPILELALGREELDVLETALHELRSRELTTVRRSVALGALGERLAREGEEVGVRRAAAGALGLIGGWSAITALEGVLDDPDVRREAAQALADMGEADASDVLLARVASGDTDLLAQTMHAIDHLDTARCLQRLNRMPALTNPEAVRKATAQVTAVLARRDEPQHADDVSRILNQLVADPEDAVRRSALEAVTGLAGWLDEQALAALAMDPDPTLAQLALSQLRPLPDDRALPILDEGAAKLLANASRHPDASVREAAIAGILRWRASYVVRRLQSGLLKASQQKRLQIVAALRRSHDGPVTTAFLDRLLDQVPTVRTGAESAIGRLDHRRLESALSSLSDEEPTAWTQARDALSDRCSNDPDGSLRRLACRALHEVGDAFDPGELAAGTHSLAFIVLLHDPDDANGLAALLDDLQQPNLKIATFAAPPARGMAFFTNSELQPDLDRWWSENVPSGALPVYLLMDEGSPSTLQEVYGRLYVGLPHESAKQRYPESSSVQPFVAGGPLDFATLVMMEFSSEDGSQSAVFDRGEALRMAALTRDFPIDLDLDFHQPNS